MATRNLKKKNRKTGRAKGDSKVEHLLTQLVQLNMQETIKASPDVPDLVWQPLRRHTVHSFVRKQNLGTITGSLTAETDGAYAFSLASLPGYTEFTNLFDTYRIVRIRVQFFPAFIDTSATVVYPPMITAIDYDDNGALTYANLQEYDTSLVSNSGTFFERTLTPRIALAAYSGTFTSYAQPKAGQWIDCASPNVTHYGLKYALPITGASNTVWQAEATYIVQFRETR